MHTVQPLHSKFRVRGRLHAAALALTVLSAGVFATRPAQAQTNFKLLHSFGSTSADGILPLSPLIRDAKGNLYGTTVGGGSYGSGTVFKVDALGRETVLYSFTGGADGGDPYGGVILDPAGNLYGTTYQGGSGTAGTVFKLDSIGGEGVVYSFYGGADGAFPESTLVQDFTGNLFGTAAQGGDGGFGVVFKVDPTGRETVVYSFQGGADGSQPNPTLLRDGAGNLYGTTRLGGNFQHPHCGASGCGVVFKVDGAGKETVLHSFTGATDGEYPSARLLRDAVGNLYGATFGGGTYGRGTVFKVDPKRVKTILYNFAGGADAASPESLVRDEAGNLYGTAGGGAYRRGTVFKVDAAGNETVLYTFTGIADGTSPYGLLVGDAAGNLYGTTLSGGEYGLGTVFKLTR